MTKELLLFTHISSFCSNYGQTQVYQENPTIRFDKLAIMEYGKVTLPDYTLLLKHQFRWQGIPQNYTSHPANPQDSAMSSMRLHEKLKDTNKSI